VEEEIERELLGRKFIIYTIGEKVAIRRKGQNKTASTATISFDFQRFAFVAEEGDSVCTIKSFNEFLLRTSRASYDAWFPSPSILALTCCANGITLHSLNHDVISSEFLGIDASDKLMVKATLGYFQDVDLFTGKQRGQRPFDATLLQAEFSVREALASVARSPPYCSRGARPAGRFTESRQVNTHVASVIGHRGSTTSPAGAAIQREGEVDRALEAAARWSGSRLEGATVARSVASR